MPYRNPIDKTEPRSLYVSRRVTNAATLVKWFKGQGLETMLPPEDLHVTVTYSRTPVDWLKMQEAWSTNDNGNLRVKPGGPRVIELLGTHNAVVMFFGCNELVWRHEDMVRNGCSWDHDQYQPHITLTYELPEGVDVEDIEPYTGAIEFGPEIFEPVDEDWKMGVIEKGNPDQPRDERGRWGDGGGSQSDSGETHESLHGGISKPGGPGDLIHESRRREHIGEAVAGKLGVSSKDVVVTINSDRGTYTAKAPDATYEFRMGSDEDTFERTSGKGPKVFTAPSQGPMPSWAKQNKRLKIVKVDEEQRMVYGWASVISEDGQPVVDTQGDVIEPHELLKATTDFMLDVRKAKAMHKGGKIGEVVHSFPLVGDIAKSLGISPNREGWIVGVKVHDDEQWKLVKNGTYKGFSIGAEAIREDV